MKENSPEELLAALDDDQQKVARQVSGPLAVLAGAGTGKTRAITYRLAYGAAIGAFDPSNVLAVTFTKRAAQEMRLRLRDLGVASVQARTFHSAALRQLQYFWPAAVGGHAPEVIERKASLIAAAAARVGIRNDKEAVRDFAAEIEWAKTAMLDAERYPEAIRLLGRTVPAGLSTTQMASLIDAYESAKEDRGVIDFGDVLLLTAGILEEREDICRKVRGQYRNFVVDEYQDVSILQQHLLDLWVGDRHDVCVVGDVAQTIYTFAGASPQYLVNFRQRHPGANIIELNKDYRSTPQIVSVANQIVGSSAHRRPLDGAVRLVSQRPSGTSVVFSTYSDDLEEAAQVSVKISEHVKNGVSPSRIAILYRINSQSEALENALAEQGISYIVHGGQRFFEREEIRRALLILRRVAASSPSTEHNVVELVQENLREVGWHPTPPPSGGALRDSWDNLNALVDLARQGRYSTLAEFLTELDERVESQTAPSVEGVTLSTLHASKGLEWDIVYIVGAAEGILPISMATTPAQKEEERRLLYVGVTRARDHLDISWAGSRADGTRRGKRQRSRLLDGIWPQEDTPRPPKRTTGSPLAASQAALKRDAHEQFCEEYGPEAVKRYDALKHWRLKRSKELSIPAFSVFTDQTLRDIAAAQPKTLQQLRFIRGVGDSKLEQFGGDVLRILRTNNVSETSNDI